MGMSDVRAVFKTAGVVADPNGISTVAAVGNNAALVIGGALASGGAVALNAGQLVTILSSADDSAISFTIVGTDIQGDALTESLTGATAAATVIPDTSATCNIVVTAAVLGAATVTATAGCAGNADSAG